LWTCVYVCVCVATAWLLGEGGKLLVELSSFLLLAMMAYVNEPCDYFTMHAWVVEWVLVAAGLEAVGINAVQAPGLNSCRGTEGRLRVFTFVSSRRRG
jgi:hypothetical protein